LSVPREQAERCGQLLATGMLPAEVYVAARNDEIRGAHRDQPNVLLWRWGSAPQAFGGQRWFSEQRTCRDSEGNITPEVPMNDSQHMHGLRFLWLLQVDIE